MGPAITRDAAGKGRERQDGAVGRGCWQRGCLIGNSWAWGFRSQVTISQRFWCGTTLSLSPGMPQWDGVSSGGSPEGWDTGRAFGVLLLRHPQTGDAAHAGEGLCGAGEGLCGAGEGSAQPWVHPLVRMEPHCVPHVWMAPLHRGWTSEMSFVFLLWRCPPW